MARPLHSRQRRNLKSWSSGDLPKVTHQPRLDQASGLQSLGSTQHLSHHLESSSTSCLMIALLSTFRVGKCNKQEGI